MMPEMRQAALWVGAHIGEHGGDPARITASGHSAGAHLASYLASLAPHEHGFPAVPIRSLLLVSGLYDLRPIATSFLQAELSLTPEEVGEWSPCDATPAPGTHVTVAVGKDETEPFHVQAQDYAFAAEKRGATILGEVTGYGVTADAHHLTAPQPEGEAAAKAITFALADAGIAAVDVDYVNAHGTSTPLNDAAETKAIKAALGERANDIPVSSTKSAIGHLLGAAGAVEAIFSILAIRDGIAPPTINLDHPSVETPIDLVPHKARNRKIDIALSNSFGFGGTNASLVFRRYEA